MDNSQEYITNLVLNSLDTNSINISYSPINHLILDKSLKNDIDKSWASICRQAKANGRKCFDSAGYSLDSYNYKNGLLTLNLSDTTYKQYITTFKNFELLKKYPHSHFPKLLSLFGLLITSDNYLIIGENSNLTRSANQLSLPGGTVQITKKLNSSYLFNEFKREVSEEIGMPIKLIKNTRLIAIATKANTNNTPRLVFLAQTSLDCKTLKNNFNHADKEFSNLVFIKNNPKGLQSIKKDIRSNWTLKLISQLLESNKINLEFTKQT